MIEHVEFPSEEATLRGLLYRPESSDDEEPPLVVMAHGTSATIGMVADRYAEAFCRAGLAVLLFDHRNFGRSEGEPRQEINPWIQCRGYRDAVTFARTLDGIDSQRIALWGDSYTGGQVIVVGAVDERVKAIARSSGHSRSWPATPVVCSIPSSRPCSSIRSATTAGCASASLRIASHMDRSTSKPRSQLRSPTSDSLKE